MKTILVVDDEPAIHRVIRLVLQDTYNIVDAVSCSDALLMLALGPHDFPDLVLSDVDCPDRGDGVLLVKTLRAHGVSTPVVLMTGGDAQATEKAAGVPVLAKPFDMGTLERFIQAALTQASSREAS